MNPADVGPVELRNIITGTNRPHNWFTDPDFAEANRLPRNTKFCDTCGKVKHLIGKKYDATCDPRDDSP